MGLPCLRQQPVHSHLSFDPMSFRSSMVYHRLYHYTTALMINHVLFLNTYLLGVMLAVASSGVWAAVCTVSAAYAGYAVLLTRGIALPYAIFVGMLGLCAWYLADLVLFGLAKWEITLVGVGIMLLSFIMQLIGHALFEEFVAPPHLYHGFLAAPVLEYVSVVFQLGFLPKLREEIDHEVQTARNAARTPLLTSEEICGTDDGLFKVAICGPERAGKSAMLRALAGEPWEEPYKDGTIGVDFRILRGVPAPGLGPHKTGRVQVWDLAGSPKFDELGRSYLRNCFSGTILVFDSTDAASFAEIQSRWLRRVDQHTRSGAPKLLVGTRRSTRPVAGGVVAAARSLAEAEGMRFVECGAEEPAGLHEAFTSFVGEMRKP